MPTDSLININGESVQTLEILFLTTMIALLPSLMVMMTSFTRYIISLSFLRNAMGTQQTPPNTVLVGIALFLTLITMNPVLTRIVDRASVPLKEFMMANTQWRTVEMYCDLAHIDVPEEGEQAVQELPLRVIVPAFMTQELQEAFYIGFLLYIPFLLIDVVVSSTLMSMGMIMLPPSMISMPFKLLLFVTLNGWEMLFTSLVRGVY